MRSKEANAASYIYILSTIVVSCLREIVQYFRLSSTGQYSAI